MPETTPVTSEEQLAQAGPGDVVTVRMASPIAMVQPGKIAAAPIAPPAGNVNGPTAIVPVIAWSQSKIIVGSLLVFVQAMGEIAVNVAYPIVLDVLSSGAPLNWKALWGSLWPPVMRAVVSGAFAYWKHQDNDVVGTPSPKP